MTDVEIDLETYDPMETSIQQCPFPHYQALREQAPVYHHPKTGMYFVSRHDTVNQVLRDVETFSSRMANTSSFLDPELVAKVKAITDKGWPRVETMLTIDPPLQTRYRKLVSRAFSARRISSLEPKVREIANALLDRFPMSGRVDFHQAFSVALPVEVIAHALNMPPGNEANIKKWSDDAVATIGTSLTEEQLLDAIQGTLDAQMFWHDLYEQRLAEPVDDILSELAHADFEDLDDNVRKLTFSEIYSIITQLMVAGNETTTKFFNETMRLLIENPDWWDRIQADPSTIPAVVEEGLRLSSPNQGLFRVVTKDTELEGVNIPEGSRVWVMFGSANRDEAVFPSSDVFDADRENLKDHLAFGKGHHFCIGAPLSRLEGRVGLEVLTARIESAAFAPDNTFEYEPSFILRGLKRLDLDIVRSR
ncbi:MAG: cytochrome P450 [Acidimicrobiia bacterium]|nr:cytochrome P450 [Acidimicrobiia bacterium]